MATRGQGASGATGRLVRHAQALLSPGALALVLLLAGGSVAWAADRVTGAAIPAQVRAEPVAPVAPADLDPAAVELGRQLYRLGQSTDGSVVLDAEQGGAPLHGKEAACVRCHRDSGMGSVEGDVRVAPISGRYLFPAPGDVTMSVMDGHVGKAVNLRHAPYTSATFERALLGGQGVDGHPLSAVMPRFKANPVALAALQAYLAQLSVVYSPGAESKVVRIATVVTPDVPAARRALFRQMMETAVRGKNASTAPQRRYMASAAAFVTRSDRKWQLEFWELTGAPDTWAAQLDVHYAQFTPFALVSGLSAGASWEPVHAFCNRHAMPCWFPSVAAPATETATGYNLYFSGGVRLEAGVLARVLAEAADAAGADPAAPAATGQEPAGRTAGSTGAGGKPKRAAGRVIQVVEDTPAARAAAEALTAALQADPATAALAVAPVRVLPRRDQEALTAALRGLKAQDQLVLWVSDLGGLTGKLADGQPVYASATLLGARLPAVDVSWRAHLRLVYPYELPEKRQANLAYLQTWLKQYNMPLSDEVMQSEVFFSVNFFTDVLQDMLDNLYRDYLVERAEDMLGRRESGKAEQETRDRVMLQKVARQAVDSAAALNMKPSDAPDVTTAARLVYGFKESQGTTVYPHLNLGPHQRYASKGAYVVGFAGPSGEALTVLHDWTVP